MYDKLLSIKRRRDSSRGPLPLRDEVESDRSRVIYSAAFRRLQRKTQVFPLEDNAAVRTRMTHSLEVAHVGRFLGSEVIERFRKKGSLSELALDDKDTQHSFQTIIEIACLIHDLGNPPFGHFGEVAVARWFENGDRNLSHHDLPNFRGFDGNPQGFRIISRLAGADGKTGMNLTLTQLASTLKYPITAAEKADHNFNKFGVFDTEREILDQLRDEFRLNPGQRFPLAYLMEAADDISYCLSDMEDGVEKGIISYEKIISDLKSEAENDDALFSLIKQHSDKADEISDVDKTVSFRSSLIRDLVRFAADQYVDSHDDILEGSLAELIPEQSTEGKLLKLIKKTVRKHIYSHRSIETLELSGLAAISSLFKHFGKLVELDKRDFKNLLEGRPPKTNCDIERRLVGFLGETHLAAYRHSTQIYPAQEQLFRAHMVVDYISGMTDGFAIDMHQILEGMKVQ